MEDRTTLPTTSQDSGYDENWTREAEFEQDLAALINRYSLENGSNTPDCVIARYLVSCLKNLNMTMKLRSMWYENQQPPWKP